MELILLLIALNPGTAVIQVVLEEGAMELVIQDPATPIEEQAILLLAMYAPAQEPRLLFPRLIIVIMMKIAMPEIVQQLNGGLLAMAQAPAAWPLTILILLLKMFILKPVIL